MQSCQKKKERKLINFRMNKKQKRSNEKLASSKFMRGSKTQDLQRHSARKLYAQVTHTQYGHRKVKSHLTMNKKKNFLIMTNKNSTERLTLIS